MQSGGSVSLVGDGIFIIKSLEADDSGNKIQYGTNTKGSLLINSGKGDIDIDLKNNPQSRTDFSGIYISDENAESSFITEGNLNIDMVNSAQSGKNFSGIYAKNNSMQKIKTGKNLELNLIDNGQSKNFLEGIYAQNSNITIETGGSLGINIENNTAPRNQLRAITAQNRGYIDINSGGDLNINIQSPAVLSGNGVRGILVWTDSQIDIQAKNINITGNVFNTAISAVKVYGGALNIKNTSNLSIDLMQKKGTHLGGIEATELAVQNESGRPTLDIDLAGDMKINLTGDEVEREIHGINVVGKQSETANLKTAGNTEININGKGTSGKAVAVLLEGYPAEEAADTKLIQFNMQAQNLLTNVIADSNAYGIYGYTQGADRKARGSITSIGQTDINVNTRSADKEAVGIRFENMDENKNSAHTQLDIKSGSLHVKAHNDSGGNAAGVKVNSKGNAVLVNIVSQNDNTVEADDLGILADGEKAYTTLTSQNGSNTVSVGKDKAVRAANGGTVHLAAVRNNITGMVEADGDGSSVDLFNAINNKIMVNEANTLSAADIVSAVHAADGGTVNITGEENIIAEAGALNGRKGRLLFTEAGSINLWGTGRLSASQFAMAAGNSDKDSDKNAVINFAYGANSFIMGDIAAGRNGTVTIVPQTQNGGLNLQGDIFAVNGGSVIADLGKNTVYTGRADDFMDINANANHGSDIYKQNYSDYVAQKGKINLTLGENSRWNVTGQSWVNQINSDNATIDLISANTNRNTNAHTLTVGTMKGDATFKMSLDRNRGISDMLYFKKADGTYNIDVVDAVTTGDMYANELDGLRFATVGKASNVKFKAYTQDAGVLNVEYEVGTDKYADNKENSVYNSAKLNTDKPGMRAVDELFTENEAAPENTARARLARSAENADIPAGTDKADSGNVTETTNFKLIARTDIENPPNLERHLSDVGKAVLDMSHANYSQAIYLDRLNKRMGEARYLEEDKEGLWVRLIHDKTDKDIGFKIASNTYELGYDRIHDCKDGKGYHRRGAALSYTDGNTSYDEVIGKGETNRKGILLYDAWFGNKGHYTDYVAKWGHLENSFDVYTKSRGEKVSGEYDNNVYSFSAEWGYKDKLNDKGWYLEPQLQMQLAHVTGADYTTSQGSKVSADSINSLIGRAGFRLGKDFNTDEADKKSTFYLKADILHEFLGGQDVTVLDRTTDGVERTIGHDNGGTWYTIGLGFSTMLSDNSFAFLDVEKVFGNDNNGSYQINGGVQWEL